MRTPQSILIGLVLALAAASAVPATDWRPCGEASDATGTLYFHSRWQPSVGVSLRLSRQGQPGEALILLDRRQCGYSVSPPEAATPAVIAGGSFRRDALPSEPHDAIELALGLREESWGLYVGNRLVAQLPPAFAPPLRVEQDAASVPVGETPQAFFQRTEDFAFSDDFLVPEGEENLLAAWQKVSGEWDLHTAIDDAVERKLIAPGGRQLEPQRSPNFYSLRGKGQPGMLTTGYPFYDRYQLAAAVQAQAGEMGLVFYVQEDGACHGFTLGMGPGDDTAVLRLWQQDAGGPVGRRQLGAVETPLAAGQWVRLSVVAGDGRIQAFIDRTRVLDAAADLPPGGLFGLYVDSETGVRFDDVRAATVHDLNLATPEAIRFHTVAASEGFAGRARPFALPLLRPPSPRWGMIRTARDETLVVGSPRHAPHVFGVDVAQLSPRLCVGLLAGWRSAAEPYLRCMYERHAGQEVFRVEEVTGESVKRLAVRALPLSRPAGTLARVRLMCDATEPGQLRFYRDGRLVLLHPTTASLGGASGIHVAGRSAVSLSALRYQFQRDDVYRNQFEKNQIFITDPFMRHWSSPEGEWIDDRAGKLWNKSDFLGAFLIRLPYVPGSQVHLGVEEGATDGAWVLSASDTGLALSGPAAAGAAPAVRLTVPVAEITDADGETRSTEEDAQRFKWYGIHREDHWLWLSSGGKILGTVFDPDPFRGRRVRIHGFTTDQLTRSHVERFNVKDFLFTESLHEWTRNGGSWEIVNRFQCQPRWSHMNGESADGVAALWTKYAFKGDFCVEMYAGMRHGWYDRAGDLNLTVLNGDNTANQGYTVTCTGWDPDHSQRLTRLYRNGEAIAETDKYLAPRLREGNVRQGYEPLVAEGRPIHGAWYYIKFRRVGTRLEYWFDNELAMTAEDTDPIPGGSLGIWTYMNSMVVARVRIAAEGIAPRRARFWPADRPPEGWEESAPPPPSPLAGLTVNARPLGGLAPAEWKTDDEVGWPRLAWHTDADGMPYFTMTSRLGAGSFMAVADTPPVPYALLAGWQFEVKRTSRAQFNLHYSLGRRNAAGEYVAERRCFEQLSGSDLSLGGHERSGQTPLPATAAPGEGWHARGEWVPVTVWVTTDGLREAARDAALLVKFEGFGNPQPSYVAQGLTGNGPGEAYAVKGLHEIHYAPPRLASGVALPGLRAFEVTDSSGVQHFRGASLAELQEWLGGQGAGTGWFSGRLIIEGETGVSRFPLSWIGPPEEPSLSASWDPARAGAILLHGGTDYPDRRLLFCQASAGGVPLQLEPRGVATLAAAVPRRSNLAPEAASDLAVTVATPDKMYAFAVPWSASPRSDVPVLIGIDNGPPLLLTFEDRELRAPLQADPARMRLTDADPAAGVCLEVGNRGLAHRLATLLAMGGDAAAWPVLQMRYRAGPMGQVSLALAGQHLVRLSERQLAAPAVRGGADWVLDDAWHTWTGQVTDAVNGGPFSRSWFAFGNLQIASRHGYDQTGLFTRLCLDDIVAGPAVNQREQLVCTPRYFDFDGVEKVSFATRAGTPSWHELSDGERAAVTWFEADPGAAILPDIGSLPDGIGHLFLKARDRKGNESAVTDVPFLRDTQAPQVTASLQDTDDPLTNGSLLSLAVTTHGGAPLDLRALQFKWDETPAEPAAPFSTFAHTPGADTLNLNWIHLFRKQLDQTANGQAHRLIVAGIADGAGNRAPDVGIPITTDYSKDKRGPTLLGVTWPPTVLWATAWEPPLVKVHDWTAGREAQIELLRRPAEVPCLQVRAPRGQAEIVRRFDAPVWELQKHPLVGFRLRRPGQTAGDKAQLAFTVELSGGQKLAFSLTHSDKNPPGVQPPWKTEWTPGQWRGFAFNLRELVLDALTAELREKAGAAKELKDEPPAETRKRAEKTMAGMRVLQAGFRLEGAPEQYLIQVQSVVIYSPWAGESVALDAYDASGVAGLTVRGSADWPVAALACKPAELRAGSGPDGWVELLPRDKAGNLGLPVAVPCWNP
ncbi:MAG: hypothetical protein BWZ02_01017 [Lentisphaerae bacterium ADurb.BinA184]|nr:MAG: hypothetical protein BWZ02_01017 [Lentisphaerae bacterium ADurb.BinA184]